MPRRVGSRGTGAAQGADSVPRRADTGIALDLIGNVEQTPNGILGYRPGDHCIGQPLHETGVLVDAVRGHGIPAVVAEVLPAFK